MMISMIRSTLFNHQIENLFNHHGDVKRVVEASGNFLGVATLFFSVSTFSTEAIDRGVIHTPTFVSLPSETLLIRNL